MKRISIEFDEKLLNEIVAFELISRSIAYNNDIVSINIAYPEHGRVKINKISDPLKTEICYQVIKYKEK